MHRLLGDLKLQERDQLLKCTVVAAPHENDEKTVATVMSTGVCPRMLGLARVMPQHLQLLL